MKLHRIILIISILAITSGVSAGNNREKSSAKSVTENSRTLKKISNVMIKQYLSAVGCKKRSSKEFVRQIKDDSNQSDNYVSEYWKVKACNKTRNLKIDFYRNGDRVEVSQYRP